MKQKIMTCLGFNDQADRRSSSPWGCRSSCCATRVVEKFLSDPARSDRVMQAVLQMTKLDIATLQRAYEGA